ncbi:hypothetical protein [Cupriavidus oxalaticus]|uniref:hypothetical protein n=1 Tax=Cupriavidus oxalaticus TaxID=96344 RepID=UPI0040343F3A
MPDIDCTPSAVSAGSGSKTLFCVNRRIVIALALAGVEMALEPMASIAAEKIPAGFGYQEIEFLFRLNAIETV